MFAGGERSKHGEPRKSPSGRKRRRRLFIPEFRYNSDINRNFSLLVLDKDTDVTVCTDHLGVKVQ